MDQKIKIAYIEDHKIVKEGVNYLLSQYDDIEIVEIDYDYKKIEDLVFRVSIDVLIMDLQLYITKDARHLNGFELCALISSKFPTLKVLAHSMYDDIENVNRFFSKGGLGFVSKKSGHLELYNAIKKVYESQRFICACTRSKTKNADKFLSGEDNQLKAINEIFTKAEKSVLERIAKGFSTKEIAQQLEISEKTVETHRKHLFDKAAVKNVAELMAFVYTRRIFME